MKEYRVMAYFDKVYEPRSYKRKVVATLEEAKEILKEAMSYYSRYPYLNRVVIEVRDVSEWSDTPKKLERGIYNVSR